MQEWVGNHFAMRIPVSGLGRSVWLAYQALTTYGYRTLLTTAVPSSFAPMWPSTVWLWPWIQKDGSYGGSPRSIRSFCAPAMATNRNTGPCAQSSAPRGTGRGLRRCGFRMAAPAGRTLLFLMNESPSRRTFWLRSTLPSRGTQRRPSILHGVECRVEDCLTNLSRLSCHGADIRSHRRSTSACWRRSAARVRKESHEE